MAYRLLALDLDGTTLDRRSLVPPATRERIAAVLGRGVEVVIVTGRHHGATHPHHRALGLSSEAICCNGAYVYDFAGRRITAGTALAPETVDRLLASARVHGVKAILYTGEAMIYREPTDRIRSFEAWAAACPEDVRPDIRRVDSLEQAAADAGAVWKLLATHDEPAGLAAWRHVLETAPDVIVEQSVRGYVDVGPPGSGKGGRLLSWAAGRGIAAEEIVAIGDNHNDIDLLTVVGCGVAVANAEPEVKAVARLLVASNEEGGVIEAIERLGLDR